MHWENIPSSSALCLSLESFFKGALVFSPVIISWSLHWFDDSVLISPSFSLMHSCFRNLLIGCLNEACISSDSKWIRSCSLWKNTRYFSNRVDTDIMNSSWTQSECFFCNFDAILLYAHFVVGSLKPVLHILSTFLQLKEFVVWFFARLWPVLPILLVHTIKIHIVQHGVFAALIANPPSWQLNPYERHVGKMQALGFDFIKLWHL